MSTDGPYEVDSSYEFFPGNVNANLCDHDADPPVCHCVHDWRVTWGNLPREAS